MPYRRLRVLPSVACRYGGVMTLFSILLVRAVTAQSSRALPAGARAVLERFVGTWDVTLTVKKPKAAVVTYKLNNVWVLDDHFLSGDTGIKSDGSRERSMFGYDPATRTYPLWIFYTSGVVAYLQRGEWDETTRTMNWHGAAADPVQYKSRCRFESDTTLHCSTQVGDGRGGTGIDFESVARRR
jgi:hypothetical protein